MATWNDITGDPLVSRNLTKQGEENFDKIFGKKKTNGGWKPPVANVAEATPATNQPVEPTQAELWSDEEEQRLEIIGQNGNIGYSLDDEAVSPDAAQTTEDTNDQK